MARYQVHIALRAMSQIDEVTAWWKLNRPAAATLVADELEAAVERLTFAPSNGAIYDRGGLGSVRRPLLPRIRYHVLKKARGSYESWPSGTHPDATDRACRD